MATNTTTSNVIDYAQVERSMGFHGAPMQKVWEGECGDLALPRGDFKPDFSVYQSRQKHFVLQDRAKRLKLHQFLARKANVLFRKATKSELRLRQLALEEAAAVSSEGTFPAPAGLFALPRVTTPPRLFL